MAARDAALKGKTKVEAIADGLKGIFMTDKFMLEQAKKSQGRPGGHQRCLCPKPYGEQAMAGQLYLLKRLHY